ncbi:MAG: N-acetyl sugar amidotransferase [Bacteroidia bacterium]
MESGYKQCVRCVLDTSAKHITFNEAGLCIHCQAYDNLARRFINIPPELKRKNLDGLISKIKRLGRNNKYDCILGLSGGVDSSYLAHLAKQEGLRPLVVHFDNGWNSELAVKNIENIVSKLNYDLFTYVINWEEFKDLQIAYLKASVVDTEVPTDYLIFAVLNKIAADHNIKYILSGYNYATEFGMPKGWNIANKFDTVNLKNIHKKFGKVKLKDFPDFGLYRRFWYKEIKGIETVDLLNNITYVKKDVKAFIQKELGWKDYGGKHYESIFTRFYQGYILVKKFKIDKRRAHWSALICSGQATKEEALADLKNEPYPIDQQMADREYVIKKFNFTEKEFDDIMNAEPIEHDFYGSEQEQMPMYRALTKMMALPVRILRKIRYVKATGRYRN